MSDNIPILFNDIDAKKICLNAFDKLKPSNPPSISSMINDIPIYLPESAQNKIWKISKEAIHNTLDYIYNIISNQCYLLCIVNGELSMYKLRPDKLNPTYVEAIKNAKKDLYDNKWVDDYQKIFINKMHPNRIMQCIVKEEDTSSTTMETNEYFVILKKLKLPDGIFILNLSDSVIMRNDTLHPFQMIMNYTNNKNINKQKEYLPILTISGQKNYIDIPIPNYDEIDNVYNKKNIYDGFITDWKDKSIHKAVFRGNPTGCGYTTHTNMRLKLLKLSQTEEFMDLLDVGITGKNNTINTRSIRFDPIHGLGMLNTDIKPSERLTYVEQSQYKYIIHIDGNVNAYRLIYLMSTGSLTLRVMSDYTSWAENYIKEYVHYIPIKKDLSNLKEILIWCKENDSRCKQIAENALNLSRIILTKNFINNYFLNIFWNFNTKGTFVETKPLFKNYQDYKDKRARIDPPDITTVIDTPLEFVKVAIIIPHRNRLEHLSKFIEHFNQFKMKSNHQLDIYVINQQNDYKFNRGLLLNIGYYLSKQQKYDRYIFHDVDSYPDQTLFDLYFKYIHYIIHFANPKYYKYNFSTFFGAIEAFTSSQFEQINGFPNTFFGWGGEDDVVYNRIVANHLIFYRTDKGRYTLEDHADPTPEQMNSDKKKDILLDLVEWKNNGIEQLPNLDIMVEQVSLNDFFDHYYNPMILKTKLKTISKKMNKEHNKINYYTFHIDFELDNHQRFIEFKTDIKCTLEDIKDSKLYKYDKNTKDIVCSYHYVLTKLKNYILHEPNIDYTFLWEIINRCFPSNDKIKKYDHMMCIFDIPLDDNSNYVDLICPRIKNIQTNYAYKYFFILKRGDIYTPIISVRYENNNKYITHLFNVDTNINDHLHKFINILPDLYNYKCNSDIKNNIYFNNIYITEMYTILITLPSYKVNFFLINNYFDIIGLGVLFENKQFYIFGRYNKISDFRRYKDIPLTLKHMNTIQYPSYISTKHFLESLYNDSNKDIPCKPVHKIVNENYNVIGILTKSNSFIEVTYDIVIDDDLPVKKEFNYNILDNQMLSTKNVEENISNEYTQYIEIETKLYNIFRLYIKNYIYNNSEERRELLDIYKLKESYDNEYNLIYDFLIKHYKHKFDFKKISHVNQLQNINLCIYKCITSKCNQSCTLIIPLDNIVTGTDNVKLYFSRLTDELIRYKLIKNFILKKNAYLPFYDNQYKINKDEILITKNSLDSYFDNLTPLKPYSYSSYEYITPDLKEIIKSVNLNEYITNQDCFHDKKVIDTRKLLFDYDVIKERIYINSSICTIQLFIDILFDYTEKLYDIVSIKQILIKLLKKHPLLNVLSLFYKEGKTLSSLDEILENQYYFTPFDFKILAEHFMLPIINITSKEKYIDNIHNKVYCISNSTLINNIIPSYSIYMHDSIKLTLDKINLKSTYTHIYELIIHTKIYKQIK